MADEVQTGMGRTGRFLAIEHEGDVDPDMIVLSKSLSGGYVPVGAVLTRKAIYQRVFSTMDRAVVHSSTFGQGSLAMVAGLAALRALDDHDLLARAERQGLRAQGGHRSQAEEARQGDREDRGPGGPRVARGGRVARRRAHGIGIG